MQPLGWPRGDESSHSIIGALYALYNALGSNTHDIRDNSRRIRVRSRLCFTETNQPPGADSFIRVKSRAFAIVLSETNQPPGADSFIRGKQLAAWGGARHRREHLQQ